MQCLRLGAAGGADRVDLGGDGQRFFGVHVQEGVDAALPAVNLGDAVQVRLDGCDGGDFAGAQLGGQLGGGKMDDLRSWITLHPKWPAP